MDILSEKSMYNGMYNVYKHLSEYYNAMSLSMYDILNNRLYTNATIATVTTTNTGY